MIQDMIQDSENSLKLNYRTRKNGMRKKIHQVGGTNSGLPRLLQFGTTKFFKIQEEI